MSNIEEDIKRCEQLTEARHANWIGISNQLAIAHIVDRVKELEENSIPKQKVIDKIEELNKKEKEELKGLKGQDRYFVKQMYQHKKKCITRIDEGEIDGHRKRYKDSKKTN